MDAKGKQVSVCSAGLRASGDAPYDPSDVDVNGYGYSQNGRTSPKLRYRDDILIKDIADAYRYNYLQGGDTLKEYHKYIELKYNGTRFYAQVFLMKIEKADGSQEFLYWGYEIDNTTTSQTPVPVTDAPTPVTGADHLYTYKWDTGSGGAGTVDVEILTHYTTPRHGQ